MAKRKWWNHSPPSKATRPCPNQSTGWKSQLLERAAQVFGEAGGQAVPPVDIKTRYAKIGQLALGNFFRRRAHQGGTAERQTMLAPTHDLPVRHIGGSDLRH
ncbi:MAG: hypothetical protein HZA59_06060 [Hydrogenophilales bacterium]|nr:hypothetical protein [Hydrogenophilales bacterium]